MTDYTAFRHMLAQESYGDIQETLAFFLEECSLDEAPTTQEVQQWQLILAQRGGKFEKLAALCQQYCQETDNLD